VGGANVPITLKFMLETGEDKPPWKSPSVENGKAIKKLESSWFLNLP
jgi:hypothetical protein